MDYGNVDFQKMIEFHHEISFYLILVITSVFVTIVTEIIYLKKKKKPFNSLSFRKFSIERYLNIVSQLRQTLLFNSFVRPIVFNIYTKNPGKFKTILQYTNIVVFYSGYVIMWCGHIYVNSFLLTYLGISLLLYNFFKYVRLVFIFFVFEYTDYKNYIFSLNIKKKYSNYSLFFFKWLKNTTPSSRLKLMLLLVIVSLYVVATLLLGTISINLMLNMIPSDGPETPAKKKKSFASRLYSLLVIVISLWMAALTAILYALLTTLLTADLMAGLVAGLISWLVSIVMSLILSGLFKKILAMLVSGLLTSLIIKLLEDRLKDFFTDLLRRILKGLIDLSGVLDLLDRIIDGLVNLFF